MTYFRVKWRRLPRAYQDFLREHLEPGGTVVVSECTQSWPTTRIGERYVFQHGAVGGLTPEEYRRRWNGPEPDGESAEAEWGFEPELLADLQSFTASEDLRCVRLRHATPEHLSGAVADLYRSWYEQRGIPTGRLLAECFLLLEPWWALRTGSVPYWMTFNTEPSRRALLTYLDQTDPYDEIRLMLFSHGVNSPGLATIPQWREALSHARKIGVFTGVDTHAYPRDFASLARAHRDLSRTRKTYPLPDPLPLPTAAGFLEKRPEVDWLPMAPQVG